MGNSWNNDSKDQERDIGENKDDLKVVREYSIKSEDTPMV